MNNPIINTARRTHALHLSATGLEEIPAQVLTLSGLMRLDLSYNLLLSLPPCIAALPNLEQLWLNNNPLGEICPEIQHCRKLKVLDLRDTALRGLPREMGRIRSLFEVDLRGTPLNETMKGLEVNTVGLLSYLGIFDKRTELSRQLSEELATRVYREVYESKEGKAIIPGLIDAVMHAFPDIDDIKQVVRHCDRLFPASLKDAHDTEEVARRLKRKFVELRRDNERTKLSADLELRMRAIYYDRIDPAAVEEILAKIYSAVPLLEDIQFLLKWAPKVLPPEADQITGELVANAIFQMQGKMTAARHACIEGLISALTGLYPDSEAAQVRALAIVVAQAFSRGRFADKKELEDLKKLCSDCATIFPNEIPPADSEVAMAIRQKFVIFAKAKDH